MNLYYEILENGYLIKDKNDLSFKLYQYEPYIPYRENETDKDYSKHAQAHIDAILESDKNKLTLEELKKDINNTQKELNLTKMAIDELMMISMEGGMI